MSSGLSMVVSGKSFIFLIRFARGEQKVRALALQLCNDKSYRNDFGDLLI